MVRERIQHSDARSSAREVGADCGPLASCAEAGPFLNGVCVAGPGGEFEHAVGPVGRNAVEPKEVLAIEGIGAGDEF